MTVKSIAGHTNNALLQTVEGALRDAQQAVGKEGAFKDGKKILILCLDDTQGQYGISWVQAGMSMSECTTLCDISKQLFLNEMGYNSLPGDVDL